MKTRLKLLLTSIVIAGFFLVGIIFSVFISYLDPMIRLGDGLVIQVSTDWYGVLLENGSVCSFQILVTGCWEVDENHYIIRGHRYNSYKVSISPYGFEPFSLQEKVDTDRIYYRFDLKKRQIQKLDNIYGLSERGKLLWKCIVEQPNKFKEMFDPGNKYARLIPENVIGWTVNGVKSQGKRVSP